MAARRIGNYELLRELGRGAMGVVYAGRHAELGREVAIKVMLAGPNPHPDAIKRFELEAQALARLNHANVVKVHEAGWEGQHRFMAMELVEGVRSLKERLGQEGPFDLGEAARLIEQVARAMQHAHDQGILHRDLKPDNILVDGTGRPLVTDFGLARDMSAKERLTRTGEVMGTPSYMPPEQADGDVHNLDARADVYSLGATLYALLTGRAPFASETLLKTLGAVMTDPPLPPSQLRAELDADLEGICLRCLEKSPADRFQSAGALAEALAHYGQLGPHEVRRRPSPVLRLAAALALLAAGGAALWVALRDSPGGEATTGAETPRKTHRVAGKTTAADPPARPTLAWVERSPAGPRPAPRSYHALVYDPSQRRTVLFGGQDGREVLGDLWTWEGDGWREHPIRRGPKGTFGPGARFAHAMAYDEARRRLVVVGGFASMKGSAVHSDTWTWTGQRWQLHGTPHLFQRTEHVMAYDPQGKVVLLFGGILHRKVAKRQRFQSAPLNDLWEWNGHRWRELPVTGSRPPPRAVAAMAYQERRGQLVLYGGLVRRPKMTVLGDMWVWTGSRWRAIEQPSPNPGPRGHTALVDLGDAGLLLVGGYRMVGGRVDYLNDTWLWNGKRWRELGADLPGDGVCVHRFVWQPTRRACLLFGGQVDPAHGRRSVAGRLWELRFPAKTR